MGTSGVQPGSDEWMKATFGITDDDLHCEICLNNALQISIGPDDREFRPHGVCERQLS